MDSTSFQVTEIKRLWGHGDPPVWEVTFRAPSGALRSVRFTHAMLGDVDLAVVYQPGDLDTIMVDGPKDLN